MGSIRFLAASLAMLTAMGIAASGASAGGPPTGNKVEVPGCSPCNVVASSEDVELKAGGEVLRCSVIYFFRVFGNGRTEVTEVTFFPGERGCFEAEAEELPWEDWICEAEGSKLIDYTFWDFSSPLGPFSGWVEPELIGAEKEGTFTATGANLEGAEIGETGATLTGEFTFSEAIALTPTEGECEG